MELRRLNPPRLRFCTHCGSGATNYSKGELKCKACGLRTPVRKQ